MASTSSSRQHDALPGIETPNKRRKVEESSRLFDVFINHRGPDVKHSLATQLYNSLEDLRIKAFLDSEEREIGDSFLSTIETAIRSASVHIAIFSQNYAQSAWCLAELVLMSQSKAKIIPIFYQVKPSDLRHIENGVYAEAFVKYVEKGRYLDKIEAWKEALQQVSYTAGYEYKNSRDCEGIVSAVEKEVKRTQLLDVAKHPVGLHKLVKDFERQCGMEKAAKEKANVVGIFGMGGVGKTTLSKELFNQKRSEYTKASFLFDVRECCASGKLTSLQSKLLKDIFCENESFLSTEEGKSCLRDRLERSSSFSFLIVLDDIDHVEQLDALLVMDILVKSGNSLVIITTRDVGILVSARIDMGYHLKGLDREDGKELFCWHALNQSLPLIGYEDLVQDFVDMCGRLPLSIIVLGRHVFGRDPRYWRDVLKKVKDTLPGDIKQRLKISIDPLESVEKQIFIDIACFFIDESITKAMTIWKGSGWRARHALQTLKEKCLVEEAEARDLNMLDYEWGSRTYASVFRMHDHLRDLGREMANELSNPRRVWHPQHLKSLELKGFQNILAQTKGRCFHSILDKSMGCTVTYFLGESEGCSDTCLLWLQLEYPDFRPLDLNSRPLDLNSDKNSSIFSWIPLQNLQCLRISNGCFQKLWQSDVQAPSNLRELQIHDTFLEEITDSLGKLNNMEKLVLHAKNIQMDIWYLLESLRMNLRSLKICKPITSLTLTGDLAYNDTAEGTTCKSLVIYDFKSLWEGKLALKNVEEIEINSCEKLQDIMLPTTLKKLVVRTCRDLQRVAAGGDLANLTWLIIADCPALEELPNLSTVSCMEEIGIKSCEKLQNIMLPTTVNTLYVNNCRGLQRVTVASDLTKLKQLSIADCPALEELPNLSTVSCMEEIIIKSCEKLQNIMLPTTVNTLYVNNCRGLQRVTVASDLTKLKQLSIANCPALEELPNLSTVSCLEEISIKSCEKLQNIMLPTIVNSLYVENCRDLQRVAAAGDLTKLTRLTIADCPALEELPNLSTVSCLEEISIKSCEKLQNIMLPTIVNSLYVENCRDLQRVAAAGDLTKLTRLTIADCPALEELPNAARVSCLEEISIKSCEKLQNIMLPTIVNSLYVENCRDLQRVAVAGDLTKLTRLTIADCPALEELPNAARVSCLEEISIKSCEKLQNIMLPTIVNSLYVENCRDLQRVAVAGDLTKLTQLTIVDCPALEELPNAARVSCLEEIKIESCEKLQTIMLPTIVNSLYVADCRDLQRVAVAGDLTKLTQLTIVDCPALEELPNAARVSCLEEISIKSYEKLQNIMLPTIVNSLYVENCRDLQRVAVAGDLTKLTQLTIVDCPALEELPNAARVSCLEEIKIESCEKLQTIMLPTTLNKLNVRNCRDLQRVAVAGDLTKLTQLTIVDCPALEELPNAARVSCLEEIKIESCEKLQNIMLPTTLNKLNVRNCRDLQRVAAAGDFAKLTQLTIFYCPSLEELPNVARVSCFERFKIISCEKLQNISSVEELHASKHMELCYCGNTLIRKCIQKLKSVPSRILSVVGRAADGAESSLNRNLFCEGNIGVDAVIEIGTGSDNTFRHLSERSLIIGCFVVVIDSSTSLQYLNQLLSFDFDYYFDYRFDYKIELREGEWIICLYYGQELNSYLIAYDCEQFERELKRHGVMKKGFWVKVRKGEEWKCAGVLSIICDRLLHE